MLRKSLYPLKNAQHAEVQNFPSEHTSPHPRRRTTAREAVTAWPTFAEEVSFRNWSYRHNWDPNVPWLMPFSLLLRENKALARVWSLFSSSVQFSFRDLHSKILRNPLRVQGHRQTLRREAPKHGQGNDPALLVLPRPDKLLAQSSGRKGKTSKLHRHDTTETTSGSRQDCWREVFPPNSPRCDWHQHSPRAAGGHGLSGGSDSLLPGTRSPAEVKPPSRAVTAQQRAALHISSPGASTWI